MNTKKYRLEKGLEGRDMIAALKPVFPKYGKATQSMVDNPDKYGVRLTREAENVIIKKFGKPSEKAAESRRKPNRTRPYRMTLYLTESEYSEVKQLMAALDCETVQQFLLDAVRDYVEWLRELLREGR
jgi:hypothetical protein